jgi:hypothetical protein
LTRQQDGEKEHDDDPSDEELIDEDTSEDDASSDEDGESNQGCSAKQECAKEATLVAQVEALNVSDCQSDDASDCSDLERNDNDAHQPFRDQRAVSLANAQLAKDDDDTQTLSSRPTPSMSQEEIRRRVKASLVSHQKQPTNRNRVKGREKRRDRDAVKHRGDVTIW